MHHAPRILLIVLLAGAACCGRACGQRPGLLGLVMPNDTQFELSETVQIDRADGTVLAHLERVKACLADRQWDEAVETLRQVSENDEGKLYGVTPTRFISLAEACQLQLAALPPEALKLYRSRIDPVAEKWYDEGTARRDRKLLSNVIRQAFASSVGDKALLASGEMALEAGDYAETRWCWERILPAHPPTGVVNTWPGYPDSHLDPAAVRARLVLVSILEGAGDRAREELAQFTRLHPDARGRLGGREVRYTTALGDLLAQSASWPLPAVDGNWPTFAGSPERNKILPAMLDVAGVAWRVQLPQIKAPLAAAHREVHPAPVAEDAATPLAFHPVVVDGQVFFGNQHEILAVRADSGKPLWGDGSQAIYREQLEAPAGALASWAEAYGTPRFTMNVSEGRLYARMGSALTSQGQLLAGAVQAGSLVCLDLAGEGKLQWKITPEEGWAFEGAPVVHGADLFIAMRRNDIRPQAHVACYDAPTGQFRWRRFVCAAETPARGMLAQVSQNLLSVAGSSIYYNTNLGAVAALSTDDGRIRWLSLYPRDRKGDMAKLAPHWQRDLNPCLVDHGTLLVAPADSPRLFGLDAASGQILWQSGTEVGDVVHLLGVVGDELIASGQRLYWIGLSGPTRGQVRHLWPEGVEKPGFGRGILAGNAVLWPTRQKIYVFDQKTARPRKVIDLEPLAVSGGNLLIAGRRLLIATGKELIALGPDSGKKETSAEVTRN